MTFNQFMKQEQAKHPDLSGDALIDSAMTDILTINYRDMNENLFEFFLNAAIKNGIDLYTLLDKSFENEEWHSHIVFKEGETLYMFYDFKGSEMLEGVDEKTKLEVDELLREIRQRTRVE